MWCVVWLRMCVDGEGGSEARARRRERTGGINTNTLSLVRLLKMTVQHVTNPHTSHPTRIPLTLAAIFSHINGKFNSMNDWKIWSRGRVRWVPARRTSGAGVGERRGLEFVAVHVCVLCGARRGELEPARVGQSIVWGWASRVMSASCAERLGLRENALILPRTRVLRPGHGTRTRKFPASETSRNRRESTRAAPRMPR